MRSDYTLRPADVEDATAISAIYNHYVLCSTCTFALEEETEDERKVDLQRRSPKHPVIVAQSEQGIIGWASLSEHKSRCGYAHTVESSVYIHPDWKRKGVGRALMTTLIAEAKRIGHHSILAGVAGDQTASMALHEALRFGKVAHYKEVGFKFEKWIDVVYFQLVL